MTITIQYNASESNRLDKDLTTIATMTGTIKTDTSITDPIILVEIDPATVTGANYLTIAEFGRSYFINDIRVVRNSLVEITCHVDVLTSFKAQIRAQTAIIGKSENDWNLYLNDGSFRTYQNPMIQTKLFPSGFSGAELILAVAGS